MTNIFSKLAEKRIREAIERGDFNDLPGKGQPLELEDWSGTPEELRLAYKILKNAGYVPPEIQAKKEILQIEDLLASDLDEKEKYVQIKKLNFLVTKLNLMRQSPIHLEKDQRYFEKVVDRISTTSKEESKKGPK